jgi:PAS domain S-box-containing protein
MSISESHRLEALYRIARTLHDQDMDVQAILKTVLSLAGEAVAARHGCMITLDASDRIREAYILGNTPDPAAERQLWDLLINRGLVGFVHHGRRTIVIRDLTTDPRWPRLPESPLMPRQGSAVGLPLEKGGKAHGVMILVHERVDYFGPEMVDMLQAIAHMASSAIGNAIAFTRARASEAHYRWLFKDSIVPILLTDLQGQVVDANRLACDLLRYNYEKLVQLHIGAIHRMGTGPIGANRLESLQAGHEVTFTTTAWTSVGVDIPVHVRARRISFEDRDLIEWIEQDITTQLELEQLRADLAAMVYHDLRGPLHTINSSFSGLARLLANADQEAVRTLIQTGLRSTRQLSRLVDSLLDIQQLEEGRAVLDRKPTSLYHLLAAAAELVQPLAAESNQRLKFNLADDLPHVALDSDMIQRVVINLLENAVKYTPANGQITLLAAAEGNRVRISVADSGPGIPGHMQRQIFDKFSRVKYKDVPKGVGLGLAFCRLAVEAHGGQIWVESEPGQGSLFVFTLPLEPLPAAQHPAFSG